MLLDTDILIDLLRGKEEAFTFLFSLPAESPHCCSVITVAEINSGMREAERQTTTELIDSMVVLPITREIAEMAGKFRREHASGAPHRKSAPSGTRASLDTGTPMRFELQLDDYLIAATAAVQGIELVTRNKRHYPMPGVRVRPVEY